MYDVYQTGRVVSTVLEPLEPVDENLENLLSETRLLVVDVADNAAHFFDLRNGWTM